MWPFCRWTKLHFSISFILFFHMIPSNSSGKSRDSQCNILAIQIKQWARLIQRVIKQLNNLPCNSMLTPLNTLRNTDGIRNFLPIVSAWPGRKKREQVKNDTSPGTVKGLCCVLTTRLLRVKQFWAASWSALSLFALLPYSNCEVKYICFNLSERWTAIVTWLNC